ncbi:MAG: type I restriction enzyme HsdR N-terminal domain-containing protein [Flavobacteriales bacterium]
MVRLNFPSFALRIKEEAGGDYIWDPIRSKWYVCTPEEWVRQHVIQYLHRVLNHPLGRIGVEVALNKDHLRRSDIVVYNAFLKPEIAVECKRPSLEITRQTFDQIARYNLCLQADYLMVTNGLTHYYARVNHTKKQYDFLQKLPIYKP